MAGENETVRQNETLNEKNIFSLNKGMVFKLQNTRWNQ